MERSLDSNVIGACPGCLVKVSKHGYASYVECAADGTLVERGVQDWGKAWNGEWCWIGQELVLSIGSYELHVPQGSGQGREVHKQRPWAAPTDFYVFTAVPKQLMAPGTDTHTTLLKCTESGIHAAELLADGLVREYRLLTGWKADSWRGEWLLADGRLQVSIGPYRWQEELTDAHGYFLGVEQEGSSTPYRFAAVCAEIDPSLTEDAIGFNPDGSPMFEANGYEFYPVVEASKGHFATVLEARKPSMTGGVQRLAAKCVQPGGANYRITVREIELTQLFSATDGLIAAFEYFQLPDDPIVYGEFAGSVVQILELGETDLQRHLSASGKMPPIATLDLARSLASALSALHKKFGFVHSDVRPANVIGRRAGAALSWRLSDFNVTTKMDPDSYKAPLRGRTASCVSPELKARIEAGTGWTEPADDIWALGLLLAQCDAGILITEPVTAQQATQLVARASPLIRDLLQGCLHPSANQRWTAEKVLAEAVTVFGPARAEADTDPFESAQAETVTVLYELEPTKVL